MYRSSLLATFAAVLASLAVAPPAFPIDTSVSHPLQTHTPPTDTSQTHTPQTDPSQPHTSQSLPGREFTRGDVETWLDGLVPYAMANGDIAGGVVVVVKDGGVLLQKGYGHADVEKKLPVDPERTLFRVGSVSKIFTWTAVMQLVDAGEIELDRDIAAYLDFEIPATYHQPITMRHLMTHTAGFEERIKNMLAADIGQLRSLEDYVKASVPARIYAPGEVPSYSNYGAALAGYIVQRVSGESFDDYLDRHVFAPLGMKRSSFRQPLPAQSLADLSQGYETASRAPWYFEICNPSPAGSLSATGADIAQFMIAQLGARSGTDSRLLSARAASVLHGSISRPIPTLDGMSLGFEVNRDARRIIGHGGDTQVFHSDLKLYLEDGVGLFMSFNSDGNDGAAWRILATLYDEFTERYSPVPRVEEAALSTALEHGRQVAAAGPYVSSRRAETSFLRLLAGLGKQDIDVRDDGTLVLPGETALNGQPKAWREVAPYVWREIGGVQRLGASVVDGQVRALGLDVYAGTQVLQPISMTAIPSTSVSLVPWAAMVLLLTVLHWPLVAVVRHHYRAPLVLAPREALARRLVRFGALAGLAFLLGWALVLQVGMKDIATFGDALDPWLRLLQLIGLATTAGAAAAIWNARMAWSGAQGRWALLWSLLVAAALFVVVWFAFAYKLMSFSLQY